MPKFSSLTAATLLLVLSTPLSAQAAAVSTDGGLSVASDDGRYAIGLGGRVHLDGAVFDNDDRGNDNVSGTEFRRIWLDLDGHIDRYDYKMQWDFSGDGSRARAMYIATDLGPGHLTVGQFKQFFTLDDRTSSKHGPLMERSALARIMAPAYQIGVSFNGAGRGWSWLGSVYNLDTNDGGHSESVGVDARVTFAPYARQGRALHFGVDGIHERWGMNSDGTQDAVSESYGGAGDLGDGSEFTLVSLNNGRSVNVDKFALEAAQVIGRWSWQAEYGGARYDDDVQKGDIDAGYVLASWFATDDSRPYDAKHGRFTRLTPHSAAGAVELVLRYDRVEGKQRPVGAADTSDISVSTWTAGVNWYCDRNLRLMLNLIDSVADDELASTRLDHTRAVYTRLSLEF